MGRKGTDTNKNSQQKFGEGDSIEHELRSQASKKSGSIAASKFNSIVTQKADFKYDIPESCYL